MKRRGVRLAVLALFFVVAAAAAVTLYEGDQRAAALRRSKLEFIIVYLYLRVVVLRIGITNELRVINII